MEIISVIQNLKKRINVSANTDTTMERASALWKSFNNAAKREVMALSEVSSATARKAYREGALTAGLAIALAKVGNVNPAYLAAQADSKGRFNQKNLTVFLKNNGYASLVEEAQPAVAEVVPEDDASAVYDFSEASCCGEEEASCCDCGDCCGEDGFDFGEDELVLLVRALNIRARWDEEARDKLDQLIALLL